MEPRIRQTGARVTLEVRARPRARRTELAGFDADGVIRIDLRAAPVDGAANEELVRFLAREVLGVPRSAVTVLRGETSRDKLVAVEGIDAAQALERLRRRAPPRDS